MNRVDRRGFALVLVLWMLVGVAAISAGLVSAGRYSVQSVTNRTLLTQGAWQAEGCVERIRAAIDDTLLGPIAAADAAWRSLDSVIALSPLSVGCKLEARPAGASLDVNAASGAQLSLMLQATGIRPERADSIADAILDWQDADDLRRVAGAEASWYVERQLLAPRNGPIASRDELRRVRDASSVPGLDSLLDVEPGRILIGRAPQPVLAALSGFGPEAVMRAMNLTEAPRPRDLLEFSALLSAPAREELLAHFADLQNRVTFSPDAWIVTARASAGVPPVNSALEVRFVRAGTRAAIVRRRVEP